MAKVVIHRGSGFYLNFKILNLNLSSKAIGIYVRMMALAQNPNWSFSVEGLTSVSKEGQKAILEGLRELEKVGLLKRRQERGEGGRMAGAVWDLYEDPSTIEPLESEPSLDYPLTEGPSGGNPSDGEPPDGGPTGGNRGQIKEIEMNQIEIKEPPTPLPLARGPIVKPKGENPGKLRVKVVPTELLPLENEILTFWNEHKGGAKTQRSWDRQMRDLCRILKHPEGGLDAVRCQIEKAENASIHGKRWLAITYSNWETYGKNRKPSDRTGGGYSSTAQPGPAIRKMTIEELRREQGL